METALSLALVGVIAVSLLLVCNQRTYTDFLEHQNDELRARLLKRRSLH